MRLRLIAILTLLFILLPSAGKAESTPWQEGENYKIRLISGTSADTPEGTSAWFAIEYALADGWQVYWRTPGDGGLPTKVDWSASQNLKAQAVSWPVPTRYVEYGSIEAYAYRQHFLLPFRLTYADPSQPMVVRANIDFALCKDICLFEKRTMELTLPPHTNDAANQPLIDGALATVPKENGAEGFRIEKAELSHFSNDAGTIRVVATSESGFKVPDLFIESESHYRFPKPMVKLMENGHKAEFSSPYENMMGEAPIHEQALILTLAEGQKAVEMKTTLPPLTIPASHYAFILFMAYLGGLILNIMPCVLPVLSLKLLGVVKHSGSHYTKVRASFLSSTLGILASFWILAALVALLEAFGVAVGWGFQFQSPLFLTFMTLLLCFFAANLFGLFEIDLPQWAGNLAGRIGGKEGYAGHFGTGVLATLLATPCSAPFLGTAIGFAFSQSVLAIFLIFTFMGIGLATPYLLFTLFPHLVAKLPKPGGWMVRIKHILGVFLLCTAVWLLVVLHSQIGAAGALWVAFFGVAALVAIPTINRVISRHRGAISLATLAAIILAAALNPLAGSPAAKAADDYWKAFDEEQIRPLVEQGKTVVVDVTADWCLTCKANKLLVLDTADIHALLTKPDVYAMKADWTERDETIAKFLMKYGRYGIPFNIVFGPGAPDGVVLPELLTAQKMEDALGQAGAKP
jgi:suppressor for copper-sensitivity B